MHRISPSKSPPPTWPKMGKSGRSPSKSMVQHPQWEAVSWNGGNRDGATQGLPLPSIPNATLCDVPGVWSTLPPDRSTPHLPPLPHTHTRTHAHTHTFAPQLFWGCPDLCRGSGTILLEPAMERGPRSCWGACTRDRVATVGGGSLGKGGRGSLAGN